jgi:archaellum component FlaC
MAQLLSFDECLKDSPAFRRDLRRAEHSIDTLTSTLETVIHNCGSMVRKGESFGQSVQDFLTSLQSVTKHDAFREDSFVCEGMNRLVETLSELESLRNLVVEQANRSIADSLTQFLKSVRSVKDTGKVFNRLSADLDSCREKYSQIPRSRIKEMDEVKNLLISLQAGFSHTSMDYVRLGCNDALT